jgi:hypothetical protein
MHRGQQLKSYSVISIILCYVFAFLYYALTLLRSMIASIIYRSGHIGAVIPSYSYCYKFIDQLYCFYSFSLSVIMYLLFTSIIPLSKELEGDLNFLAEFALNTCKMYTQNKIFN